MVSTSLQYSLFLRSVDGVRSWLVRRGESPCANRHLAGARGHTPATGIRARLRTDTVLILPGDLIPFLVGAYCEEPSSRGGPKIRAERRRSRRGDLRIHRISAPKSCHPGFIEFIKSILFCRDLSLICFSRSIAGSISSNIS